MINYFSPSKGTKKLQNAVNDPNIDQGLPSHILLVKVIDQGNNRTGNKIRRKLYRFMKDTNNVGGRIWYPRDHAETSQIYWGFFGQDIITQAWAVNLILDFERSTKISIPGNWRFTVVLSKPVVDSDVIGNLLNKFNFEENEFAKLKEDFSELSNAYEQLKKEVKENEQLKKQVIENEQLKKEVKENEQPKKEVIENEKPKKEVIENEQLKKEVIENEQPKKEVKQNEQLKKEVKENEQPKKQVKENEKPKKEVIENEQLKKEVKQNEQPKKQVKENEQLKKEVKENEKPNNFSFSVKKE
ncbi:hypothetical protein ACTFIT_008451 [Dictyostelium discoideum]